MLRRSGWRYATLTSVRSTPVTLWFYLVPQWASQRRSLELQHQQALTEVKLFYLSRSFVSFEIPVLSQISSVLASVSSKATSHSVTVEICGDTGATLAAVVLDIQSRIKLLHEENARFRDTEASHLVQIAELSARLDALRREAESATQRASTLQAQLGDTQAENRDTREEVARLCASLKALQTQEADLRLSLAE
jgi:hypothetical protein